MVESSDFSSKLSSLYKQVKLDWTWNSVNNGSDYFMLNSLNYQNIPTSFTLPEDNTSLKPILEIDFNQSIKLNRFKILSNSKLIEIYYKEPNENHLNYVATTRYKEQVEVDSQSLYLTEFEFEYCKYNTIALKFLSLPIDSKSELKVIYVNFDIDESSIVVESTKTLESDLAELMKSKLNIQDNEPTLSQKVLQLESYVQLLELKFESELSALRSEIKELKKNQEK
ncbi:hypothetical protein CONCODRAFT_80318 [Conidiobolus coronatus NRRL 28638]|uniref:Uncharacterized protein n=1 Tax=Conidiobolus coronatus (strain ATCC 28846 / CBS 209.66 / NRRL 28638) TaxID=796925 RepID=A0A137NW23_CONC2|nr:hypothetical protein CONCODRAFT_80318 [Conidiobolus coronatus NRRL 28638]|eukprot:KXN67003.1 hypothetical protein CONCODRAFT_80318 [Conidiobolus coronatus NRRL 28638]